MRERERARESQRELEEETGYYAKNFKKVVHGPVSAGMSDEANDLYIAWDLEKVSEGGGVGDRLGSDGLDQLGGGLVDVETGSMGSGGGGGLEVDDVAEPLLNNLMRALIQNLKGMIIPIHGDGTEQ